MKHINPVLALVVGLWWTAHSTAASTSTTPPEDPARPLSADMLVSAGVPFIENVGQVENADVRFYARTFAGTVFVTSESQVVYKLPVDRNRPAAGTWAFRESFAAALDSQPRGDSNSPVHVSHFKGSDPHRWHTQLDAFAGLDLGEPYPGVRVRLVATGNSVEKIFRVGPGGDVGAIAIAIDGVESLSIDTDGRLVLGTARGEAVFSAPLAYEVSADQRRPVAVEYVLAQERQYGFRVGEYDKTRELIIDPLLAATYLGGHNPQPPGNYDDDIIWGLVAEDGNVIVGGATQSPDFPTLMGYDDTLDSSYPDGFLSRLSGDLSTLIASTYIGTPGFDRVAGLAVDADGTVIAVGQAGYDFPVTDGAYNWNGTTPAGGGFVARFSADLSTLLGSALVTPSDHPTTVALGNGGIYFGGSTNNRNFPVTPDAYKTTCCPPGSFSIPEYDGFAGKLSLDLSTLQAMTYLGGTIASDIAVAPNGEVFITDGWDYAVGGYVARFDDHLTDRSAYLSYYPGSTSGSSRTYFNAIVAADSYVVAAGQTYMNDLPATDGAFDTTCGTDGLCDGVGDLLVPRSDGFIAIYTPDLQNTLFLTYLGGSHHESVRALALAAGGQIYVAGETTSVDFPTVGSGVDTGCGTDGLCDTVNPSQPTADGFIARLSPDLSTLDFATYLGGSGEDLPTVVSLDAADLVYVGGFTDSQDFPTTAGAFDETFNGGTSDAFVSLLNAGVDNPPGTIFGDGFESGDCSNWSIEVP